eukprot:2939890-Pyramimonas_sp.AAC.1
MTSTAVSGAPIPLKAVLKLLVDRALARCSGAQRSNKHDHLLIEYNTHLKASVGDATLQWCVEFILACRSGAARSQQVLSQTTDDDGQHRHQQQ